MSNHSHSIFHLIRNSTWTVLGYTIPLLAVIWSIPATQSELSPPMFGLVALAWASIGYAALLDFGTNKALCFEMAKSPLGDFRAKQVAVTVIFINTIILFLLLLVIVIFRNQITVFIIGGEESIYREASSLVTGFCVSMPFVIFSATLRAMLESQKHFKYVALGRLSYLTWMYAAPVTIYQHTNNLELSIYAVFSSKLLQFLIYFLAVTSLNIVRIAHISTMSKSIVQAVLSYSGWLSVSIFLSSIIVYSDRVNISRYISVAAVGEYTVSYEFATKLLIISVAISSTAFPYLAKLHSDGDEALLRKWNMLSMLLIAASLVFSASLIIFYGDEILQRWLGDQYKPTYFVIVKYLLVGVIFNSFGQQFLSTLHALGETKIVATLHAIELPIYIASLVYVCKVYGSLEAVAAVWSARAFFDSIMLATSYFYLRRRRSAEGT